MGTPFDTKFIIVGMLRHWTLSLEFTANLALCQYAERSLEQDVAGFIFFGKQSNQFIFTGTYAHFSLLL